MVQYVLTLGVHSQTPIVVHNVLTLGVHHVKHPLWCMLDTYYGAQYHHSWYTQNFRGQNFSNLAIPFLVTDPGSSALDEIFPIYFSNLFLDVLQLRDHYKTVFWYTRVLNFSFCNTSQILLVCYLSVKCD